MAADRSADRHARPARVIRPDPPELWDRLGAVAGERGRSAIISDLIRRYLAGEPMPPRPWRQGTGTGTPHDRSEQIGNT